MVVHLFLLKCSMAQANVCKEGLTTTPPPHKDATWRSIIKIMNVISSALWYLLFHMLNITYQRKYVRSICSKLTISSIHFSYLVVISV